jgi:hypothetical protein
VFFVLFPHPVCLTQDHPFYKIPVRGGTDCVPFSNLYYHFIFSFRKVAGIPLKISEGRLSRIRQFFFCLFVCLGRALTYPCIKPQHSDVRRRLPQPDARWQLARGPAPRRAADGARGAARLRGGARGAADRAQAAKVDGAHNLPGRNGDQVRGCAGPGGTLGAG